MSDDKQYHDSLFAGNAPLQSPEPSLATPQVPEPSETAEPPAYRWPWISLGLFLATCLSTFLVGCHILEAPLRLDQILPRVLAFWADGLTYAVCVMTILVCHEAGHFFQTLRYGVHASYPLFLPMPISPIGTFGAVIAMDSRVGDRKALFDIGISGPIAGLIPTLIFCILGFSNTRPVPGADQYGDPLLFHILSWIFFPNREPGTTILLPPMLFAGWVGLLITSLNLMPIGQLDGGHILYGLLRKRANTVASFLLAAALILVVLLRYDQWLVMLFLVAIMGPHHPPTANDNVPLGPWRIVLGWLMLAFIVLGFTPRPF